MYLCPVPVKKCLVNKDNPACFCYKSIINLWLKFEGVGLKKVVEVVMQATFENTFLNIKCKLFLRLTPYACCKLGTVCRTTTATTTTKKTILFYHQFVAKRYDRSSSTGNNFYFPYICEYTFDKRAIFVLKITPSLIFRQTTSAFDKKIWVSWIMALWKKGYHMHI